MDIIVAKTAGFCFGVKRAVDLAFTTKSDKPTYTLGPIIHNDSVVNQLKEKGISPIESLEGKEIDTLIIRSHGVAPEVYNQAETKEIHLLDATCPYVKKIHKLVEKYSKEGFGVIVIGDKDHPEIVGINGWGNNECIIIKDIEDEKIKQLDQNKDYLVVSQTTYKKRIVDDILEYFNEHNYHYKYINTICNATTERQDEALQIAAQVDCMLVIGSSYSSNTQKLYEICQKECPNTYCIATKAELEASMFEGCKVIGITAGASAPSNIIEEVIQTVRELDIK